MNCFYGNNNKDQMKNECYTEITFLNIKKNNAATND